jgi:hypothetical protein
MKRITFLIASILCLISCNNEADFFGPEANIEESRIALNLPDARVQTYSTATPNECMIDNLWVLEFNGANLVNDTLISGTQIVGNGSSVQLLPQLPFKPTNGNRIVIIANSDATTFPHPNRSAIQLSNINTYFPLMLNGYYFGGEHLPMYGEIINWPTTYSCNMIRAVAKIQIQMDAEAGDVTGNFNPENVTYKIHNGALGGYIQPQVPLQGIPQSGPASTVEDYCLLQKANATEKETTVYLYEYPSSDTTGLGVHVADSVFSASRQYIILAKKVGANTTYYRMDFYDPLTKKFFDTKRNYHYIFTIHKISSEGYTSKSDATNNPGSNIEYTVEVRDGSSHVTSNGQYAIVTSVDSAYVKADTANAAVATVRYQLPAEMTAPLNVSTNSITLTDITPAGSITLDSPAVLTDMDTPIRVTTTAAFTSARVKLTLGNIVHYVVIQKK